MTATVHGPILIVEDDDSIRDSLAELLRDEGHEVETASDGAQGLARMRARRPCVVLLDLMMPIMSGWEVHQAMLADASLRELPVLVISAVIERVPSGVQGVFRKPLRLAPLLQSVEDHC